VRTDGAQRAVRLQRGAIAGFKRRIGLDVATSAVASERFVEIDGRRLFFQEAGDPAGPPVVFFHGAGCRPSLLPPLLEGLARRGLFVVAAEHPGMGRSEHLPSYAGDLFERYAVAYYRFLRSRRLRRPVLVAQSFGGGPAHALAALAPEELESHGGEGTDVEDYRPRALVLVDCFMGQPPGASGLSGLYGSFLRNLPLLLRVPSRRLRWLLTSFFTGTPADRYRNDVAGDAGLAASLGSVFAAFARGAAPVTLDYASFVLSGDGRPLVLVWGEKDGTRLLDYGEWGARLTAIGDARALYHRVAREVAERLAVTEEISRAGALDRARDLVRMSVIPGAGHAGLYTRTHRDRYLDEIVEHLRAAGALPAA